MTKPKGARPVDSQAASMAGAFLSFGLFVLVIAGSAAAAPLRIEEGVFVEDAADGTAAPVFLNGVNLAWFNFAADFGSNWGSVVPDATFAAFNDTASKVAAAGGNSLRFWVSIEAFQSSIFGGLAIYALFI